MLCSLESHFYCFYECVCFHLHTCCVCVYTCWYGVCACAHVCGCVLEHKWRYTHMLDSEQIARGGLFFCHVDPGPWTQVLGLDNQHLYSPNHPMCVLLLCFKILIKSNSCYWCPVWEYFAKSKTTKTYLYVLFYNLDRLVLRVVLFFELILV